MRAKQPLGRGFGRLWSAAIASNLADGLGRTSLALIATTLTHDPFLIALVEALAFLPWFLCGLPAGMLLDRVDKRVAMATANGVRVFAALVISVAATSGTLTIWLLYAAILVWGVGETIFDTGSNAIVPAIVPRAGLEAANGRLQAAQVVVDTFIGAPVSGVLFAFAVAAPVLATSAGYAVSAVLIVLLPASVGRALRGERQAASGVRSAIRRDAAEAFRFIWRHRLLRSLLGFTVATGSLFAFGQAAVVLYFLHTMAVPPAWFGTVLAVVGVGALGGAVSAGSLVRRFGRGRVMLASTTVAGLALAAVGVAPVLVVAIAVYAVSALAISVWNVPWAALRQELIPAPLLGRTIGVMRSLTWGTMPVAAAIGGAVARIDLRLPFIIGGLAVAVIAVSARKLLRSVDAAQASEPSSAASPSAGSSAGSSTAAG